MMSASPPPHRTSVTSVSSNVSPPQKSPNEKPLLPWLSSKSMLPIRSTATAPSRSDGAGLSTIFVRGKKRLLRKTRSAYQQGGSLAGSAVSSTNPLFEQARSVGPATGVSGRFRVLSNRWKGYVSRSFRESSQRLLHSWRGDESYKSGGNNYEPSAMKSQTQLVEDFVKPVRDQCVGFSTLMFPIQVLSLEDLEKAAAYMLWDITPNFQSFDDFTNTLDFVRIVRKHYVENPYHSFRHVIDVMQMMYVLIKETDVGSFVPQTTVQRQHNNSEGQTSSRQAHRFRSSNMSHVRTMSSSSESAPNSEVVTDATSSTCFVDRHETFGFELLTACLCHDLGHNGASNKHLRDTNHQWVQRYGRSSTMERYHASLMESLIRNHPIMSPFDQVSRQAMIKEMEHYILCTDMELHNKLLDHFVEEYASDPSFSSAIARRALGILLVKVCDVSNVARPLPIAQEWSILLAQEHELFSLQASETSVNSDAKTLSRDTPEPGRAVQLHRVAGSTHSFIMNMVMPMCRIFGKVAPGAAELLKSRMQSNLTAWEGYLEHPESYWENVDLNSATGTLSLSSQDLGDLESLL